MLKPFLTKPVIVLWKPVIRLRDVMCESSKGGLRGEMRLCKYNVDGLHYMTHPVHYSDHIIISFFHSVIYILEAVTTVQLLI